MLWLKSPGRAGGPDEGAPFRQGAARQRFAHRRLLVGHVGLEQQIVLLPIAHQQRPAARGGDDLDHARHDGLEKVVDAALRGKLAGKSSNRARRFSAGVVPAATFSVTSRPVSTIFRICRSGSGGAAGRSATGSGGGGGGSGAGAGGRFGRAAGAGCGLQTE